jgi:hypothetical protein
METAADVSWLDKARRVANFFAARESATSAEVTTNNMDMRAKQ